MKNLFRLVFILISISVISCTEAPIVENEQVSLAGNWKFIAAENHDTNNVITYSELIYEPIYLSFNETDDNNNLYISTQMGSYHVSYMYESDTSVRLNNSSTNILLCGTGMFFSFWDQKMLIFFKDNTSYNFELQDNTLRIYYEDDMKSILLEFVE